MVAYTRQSTITDGDTITAALFNDEYNQLLSAFSYASSGTTGHKHDGTAGEGGNIPQIGDQDFLNKIVTDSTNNRFGIFVEVSSSAVEQIRIQDGAIVPVTDNDIDLGTSSLEFKDAFFDGTLTTDALVADTADINGGTVDGVTIGGSSAGAITGTTITGTSFVIGSADISEAELETIDGVTAGTVSASKAVIVDSNKDISGARNVTITGELDAATLDISGDVDVDGTLEADAITVDGTSLAEVISDTVGAMVGSNTETGISVTYEDGDNTLDFVLGSSQTTISSLTNTSLVVGRDADNQIKFDTDNEITFRVSAGDGVVFKASGEIEATSLDISGDVDVDGTLETDALSINSTAVTSTAAELNILDGVTSTTAELNILDGVTSTTAELNILDGVTSTTAELNILDGVTSTTAELNILDGVTSTTAELNILDGVTSTTAELNILDGVTASATDINLIDGITNGTVIASKAIITDANKDISGGRNITISGELDAATLDISGDADIDGTLEADAITVDGVTLAETISDTVGAMVSSNTETGISVTYQDGDNTLDFALDAAQTTITSLLATDIKIGEDDQTKIDFETADEIHFYAANAEQVFVSDGVFGPQTDSDVDLGTTSTRFKDAFIDTVTTTGLITSGSNLVIANAGNIGSVGDTDSIAIASDGVVTFSQAPVFPNGSINILDLDIDGGTDIGADIVDADLFIIDDAAGGTNRKTAASRLKTYIQDAGTVLQVVTASNTGSVTTTSTSFADISSVSATITPASSSNKILVLSNSDGIYTLVGSANVTYTQNVLRDSTSLGERSTTAASGGGGLQSRGSMTLALLDSPSSTSELTYKMQHKVSNASSTGTAANTHITLLEIQG